MKKDPMNPMTWNSDQWKDALIGAVLTSFLLGMVSVVTFIFH